MTYKLSFVKESLKEWEKLDGDIKALFKKQLEKVLIAPRNPSKALAGHSDMYKIKLRNKGYRLLYKVEDDNLIVLVVYIGRRDDIYKSLRTAKRNDVSDVDTKSARVIGGAKPDRKKH